MAWREGEMHPGAVRAVTPASEPNLGVTVRFLVHHPHGDMMADAHIPITRLAELMDLLEATSIDQLNGCWAELVFNAQGALVAVRRDGGSYQL